MRPKIVDVINVMITKKYNISNIIKQQDEFFFLYKGEHKWSILKVSGGYHLLLYTIGYELNQLAELQAWQTRDFEAYISTDFDKEDQMSFERLYDIVSTNRGVDTILDDILKD